MQAVGAEAAWDLSVGGRTNTAPPAVPLGGQAPPSPPVGSPTTGCDGGTLCSNAGFVTVCMVDSGERQAGAAALPAPPAATLTVLHAVPRASPVLVPPACCRAL